MGFLDKVKAQTEQVVKQGQDKIDEAQAKRKADGLLRSLGAWHYATETGRDGGNGPAELARITAELQAHEAEHGPLGGSADEEPEAPAAPIAPAPPAPTTAPPAPDASWAPPAPGSVPPPPGSVPPPPGAPPADPGAPGAF